MLEALAAFWPCATLQQNESRNAASFMRPSSRDESSYSGRARGMNLAEPRFARPTQEMQMKLTKLKIAAIALIVAPAVAYAAPRAESAQECGVAADMAIVARSLADEQVQPPKAEAIMSRIYDVAESERGKALMKDILDAAYKMDETRPGTKFAEELFVACMKTSGDMDQVLGSRL